MRFATTYRWFIVALLIFVGMAQAFDFNDFYELGADERRLTAGWQPIPLTYGDYHLYNWDETDLICDFNSEWITTYNGYVYSEPHLDSDIIFEGDLINVRIIDGISFFDEIRYDFMKYNEEELNCNRKPYGPDFKYVSWFKLVSGNVVGWIPSRYQIILDKETYSEKMFNEKYFVLFKEDFAPIREGPNEESPALQNYIWDTEVYITPNVVKGEVANITGRYDDWLSIKFGYWDEGWIKYDPSVISSFRAVTLQRLAIGLIADHLIAYMRVLFPVDDQANGIVLELFGDIQFLAEYFDESIFEVSTKDKVYSSSTEFISCKNGCFYCFVSLPTELDTDEIESIKFIPVAMLAKHPDHENELVIEITADELWGETEE